MQNHNESSKQVPLELCITKSASKFSLFFLVVFYSMDFCHFFKTEHSLSFFIFLSFLLKYSSREIPCRVHGGTFDWFFACCACFSMDQFTVEQIMLLLIVLCTNQTLKCNCFAPNHSVRTYDTQKFMTHLKWNSFFKKSATKAKTIYINNNHNVNKLFITSRAAIEFVLLSNSQ